MNLAGNGRLIGSAALEHVEVLEDSGRPRLLLAVGGASTFQIMVLHRRKVIDIAGLALFRSTYWNASVKLVVDPRRLAPSVWSLALCRRLATLLQ